MNLEAEILREHSKRQVVRIMTWVGRDPDRFAQLMQLFLKGEYRVTQRSAWAVMHCATRHPELIGPWLGPMIGKMQEPGLHVAVQRNVLRILQDIDIPKKLVGKVTDLCFRYLTDHRSPIAVKVFSMTILGNIAEREPDLKRELKATIEQMLPYASAGLKVRGRDVLKQLGSENDKHSRRRL
jgi:hypothetical protein